MWPFKKNDPPIIEPYQTVEFDIEHEDVISIERKKRKTIIGFYSKKDLEITEWTMFCSPEQHENFIHRFRCKAGLTIYNKKSD